MGTQSHAARGVLLAGVHRWGESTFEQILPRPLIPIADSPVISFALRWLRDADVRCATICANSESRLMRRVFGDGSTLGVDLSYFEDMSPRGPAGCVRDAGVAWSADNFIVVEGSVIPSLDLGEVLAEHERSAAAITVVVEELRPAGADAGAAALRPVGIYIIAQRVIGRIQQTGFQDIKEGLIPALHKAGEVVLPYRSESPCPRITNMDTYLAASEWAIRRVVAEPVGDAWGPRRGEARMHPTAEVDDGARLLGPVIIGPGARIAAGATIVGPTVIGSRCVVAHDALICRSALWDRCHVGAAAAVDHSVLSFDAQVLPGANLANRLHIADIERQPGGSDGQVIRPDDGDEEWGGELADVDLRILSSTAHWSDAPPKPDERATCLIN